MTVTVDKDTCIGCGLCTNVCSDVFELGNDGKSNVKVTDGDKKFACTKDAADACPVQAISIK